ncbi:hypothetical protein HispidOSU_002518 [Sigmodon hispidus]
MGGRSDCREGPSSLYFPCGPGHGTTRDPSLPQSVPCWLARRPGTKQDMQRSSGHVPGSRGQSTVPREFLVHCSRLLGSREETTWRGVICLLLAGGLLLVEVAGHAG